MITQFVTDELQHLPTLLTKDKAEYIIKLLPYIVPKIAPAEAPIGKNYQERSLVHSMFKTRPEQNTLKK